MVSNELVICKLCKSVHVIVLTCSKWMTFESIIQGDGLVTKRPYTCILYRLSKNIKITQTWINIIWKCSLAANGWRLKVSFEVIVKLQSQPVQISKDTKTPKTSRWKSLVILMKITMRRQGNNACQVYLKVVKHIYTYRVYVIALWTKNTKN